MSTNPGSEEARAIGCNCPVMDNNRGKYPPYPPDGWALFDDCPVHGAPAPAAERSVRSVSDLAVCYWDPSGKGHRTGWMPLPPDERAGYAVVKVESEDASPTDDESGRIHTGARVRVPLGKRGEAGRIVGGTVGHQSGGEWWVVYDPSDHYERTYDGGYYQESEIGVQEELDRKEQEEWRQKPTQ